MSVKDINKDQFQKEVIENKGIVLVDFYADWCGPCQIMTPLIDELSEEMKDVSFVKVNVDENGSLASEYSVSSIPSFYIFKDGKVVSQFLGVKSKEDITNEINKVNKD